MTVLCRRRLKQHLPDTLLNRSIISHISLLYTIIKYTNKIDNLEKRRMMKLVQLMVLRAKRRARVRKLRHVRKEIGFKAGELLPSQP